MASIQPIEGASVHKIQSGQVIVDLCSVVKELVENSLDAGATSIDVRFKNHGLESIEVQDNGFGIPKEDYESIALKHYTSKLRSYEDLSKLSTFGFRGEAISSLCALSDVHILTAREDEQPKGSKLVFATSGKLKSTQVVAAQRGTTVAVETIFKNLPVRRQELEKNIKREYGKVLGLLQAYACISTDVKFQASNIVGKKKALVFSTKSNATTRDNIANVFGAKTLSALIPLDLSFEMQPTSSLSTQSTDDAKRVQLLGHVSRPVVGEGRLTPDRQMFFVNSRPCTLPQVARVINEVYKTYNLSQSPFILADIILDTNAYDVNVSPDKRTILLHDQGALLDSIKETLVELFQKSTQSVPQSQKVLQRLPAYKPLSVVRRASISTQESEVGDDNKNPNDSREDAESNAGSQPDSQSSGGNAGLIHQFLGRKVQDRVAERITKGSDCGLSADKQKLVSKFTKLREQEQESGAAEYDDVREPRESISGLQGVDKQVDDFNARLASQENRRNSQSNSPSPSPELEIPSVRATPAKPTPGIVPNAFERMRPMRTPNQTATITIGSRTTTSTIGSQAIRITRTSESPLRMKVRPPPKTSSSQFSSSLRSFAAAGSQLDQTEDLDDGGIDSDDGVSSSLRVCSEGEPSENESEDDPERSKDPEEGEANADENKLMEGQMTNASKDESLSDDSDGEWLDEEAKKAMEDARVAKLIQEAEAKASRPSDDSIRRAQHLLKGGKKDATLRITQTVSTSVDSISAQVHRLATGIPPLISQSAAQPTDSFTPDNATPEEKLSLTVSKNDFLRMRIVGQFNLGFIIAFRPSPSLKSAGPTPSISDELFIIDQHASDEKSNFERLQTTTIVQSQALVTPLPLSLTAIQEELILDNNDALLRNGFQVSLDDSGTLPIGQRCHLLTLPTSKEVTFSVADLEELLVLLAEDDGGKEEVRPGRVRRMFAMRACRSSVMVGKGLGKRRMEGLVRRMGEVKMPWNCPHGRPTMRHLVGLGSWRGWQEGEGRSRGEDNDGEKDGEEGGESEDGEGEGRRERYVNWHAWLAGTEGSVGMEEDQQEIGNGEESASEGEGDEGDEEGDEDGDLEREREGE